MKTLIAKHNRLKFILFEHFIFHFYMIAPRLRNFKCLWSFCLLLDDFLSIICGSNIFLIYFSGKPMNHITGWRHFVDNDISWTLFFKMGDFSWTFSKGDISWTILVKGTLFSARLG